MTNKLATIIGNVTNSAQGISNIIEKINDPNNIVAQEILSGFFKYARYTKQIVPIIGGTYITMNNQMDLPTDVCKIHIIQQVIATKTVSAIFVVYPPERAIKISTSQSTADTNSQNIFLAGKSLITSSPITILRYCVKTQFIYIWIVVLIIYIVNLNDQLKKNCRY